MTHPTILFSQVREDPSIELYCLNQLTNAKVLLVGSGGCTALSLIANGNVQSIDIIDLNISQLYLIQLKIQLILKLQDLNKILDFYEGKLTKPEYDQIFNSIDLSESCRDYFISHMDLIYQGINQSGVYEQLFKELITSNYDYEQVFSNRNLIQKFGLNAVKHSTITPFSVHFKQIMTKYHNNYTFNNNYFYHQMVYNSYNRNCLPHYLQNLNELRQNLQDVQINYIHADYCEYIRYCNKTYDLIQTSNLTDWMNEEQIDKLLSNISNKINQKNFIVLRKFNGDYDLKHLASQYFKIHYDIPHDTSEFYNEVIVCSKVVTQ